MKLQTATEERFNSITHLLGTIAALVGLILLLKQQNDPWELVSFIIFGTTMVLLYAVSTLYHALNGRLKKVLRKLDHLAIYILIAGTYAPFTLVTLRNDWGWPVFGVVWLLALFGIIIDLLPNNNGRRVLPVVIYLAMGWMALLLARPLLDNLPLPGFIWLLCGGLSYTLGLVFYGFDARVKFFHAIWHLFVLAGSFFHFLTVYNYVS